MTRAAFGSHPTGFAVAALALLLGACCEKPTKPCLPWLVGGETYRVELVQHFDMNDDDDYEKPVPYERYRAPERTCGEGLDLQERSTLLMTAAEKVDGDGHHGCAGGCYYRRANVEIAGVTRTDGDVPETRSPGTYDFSDSFNATIGTECTGVYTLGIVAVSPEFIVRSEQSVATDHMLYRVISSSTPERCLVPGSQILAMQGCWDSWAVRIWDSKGKLITKDLPAKTSDAGADISGPDNDDGGV